jgi:hypothetical protein
MKLTAIDLKIVRSALADAIDDRDSYLDCLMQDGKVMIYLMARANCKG